jgi:hypothetical protein
MKPVLQKDDNRTRQSASKFPITDFNYHSIALGGCGGSCAKVLGPSFHTLSRDYFNTEARRYFLAEAIVFGSIMAMAAFPILNGARAMMELIRVTGGI